MKTILALTFLLLMAGCRSGHVSIAATGGDAGTTPRNDSVRESAYSKMLSEQESPASVVFFAAVDTTIPGKLLPSGIGFLPTSAETDAAAYVFPGALEASASIREMIAPWNNGVVYAKSVDGRHDALGFTDLLSLDTSDLFVHSAKIKALAASTSFLWAAWIDSSENVYVFNASTGKVAQLELKDFIPTGLKFGPADQLIVRGAVTDASLANPSRVLIFELAPQQKVQLEINAKAAAISGSGRYLAEVKSGGSADTLVVYDQKHPGVSMTVGAVLPDSPVEPVWSSDRYLAYVAEDSASSVELRVADLSAKKSYRVTGLDVPPGKLKDVVCPAFERKVLYFGGRENGQYVIFRAGKTHGRWHAEVFARPSKDDQGFVCPRASE